MDSLGSEQQESTSSSAQITIGYYNLRGKAQVCRLLAEYFGVSYVDRLFTLAEWDRFKTQHTKNWSFPDLPYLQENDFVITESVPMCLYLCDRFGPASFLGVSEADQALVTMYLWTIEAMANVITINCQQKSKEEMDQFKQLQWQNNVCPQLLEYEKAAQQSNWYLGYLSIIDFSIYELVRYMENIFPDRMGAFKRIKRIEQALGELPAIASYQLSPRAITEWCPTKLLEELYCKSDSEDKKAE